MASQLITGGQPSQGTMNLQRDQANRIITQMNKSTTERGQDIAARGQMAGQASQERMATQQEQGVTQRNDAQIAAAMAAREEDRLNSEELMRIQNDNVLQRDEISRNWQEKLANRDFEAAQEYQNRYMTHMEETDRLQAGADAAKWKAMDGYLAKSLGNLTKKMTDDKLFNEAVEQGEVLKTQDDARKNAIESRVGTWSADDSAIKGVTRVGMNKLPSKQLGVKPKEGDFDPFSFVAPGSQSRPGSDRFRVGVTQRLDDIFESDGMAAKVNSRILLDPVELAKVAPSWGSAEYWTATDLVNSAIDKYKTFADGKEKEDSLLKLYQMQLNLGQLLNGPDKDHITGLKQRRSQSSLAYAAKRRADEGGGAEEWRMGIMKDMSIFGELSPTLENSYRSR